VNWRPMFWATSTSMKRDWAVSSTGTTRIFADCGKPLFTRDARGQQQRGPARGARRERYDD
jgi:hypothetical protein